MRMALSVVVPFVCTLIRLSGSWFAIFVHSLFTSWKKSLSTYYETTSRFAQFTLLGNHPRVITPQKPHIFYICMHPLKNPMVSNSVNYKLENQVQALYSFNFSPKRTGVGGLVLRVLICIVFSATVSHAAEPEQRCDILTPSPLTSLIHHSSHK